MNRPTSRNPGLSETGALRLLNELEAAAPSPVPTPEPAVRTPTLDIERKPERHCPRCQQTLTPEHRKCPQCQLILESCQREFRDLYKAALKKLGPRRA